MEVGQEVAIGSPTNSLYGEEGFHFGVVTKITPSGQVTVAIKHADRPEWLRRFDNKGYEIGGYASSKYTKSYIREDVDAVRKIVVIRKAKRKAAAALTAAREDDNVFRNYELMGKERLREVVDAMLDKVLAARALIEQIPEGDE
jgi:hypothetical protein